MRYGGGDGNYGGAGQFLNSPTFANPTFTGQGVFAAGSATTPSVTSTGNLSTGLYWTTNTLNGTAAGASVFSFMNGSAIFQGTWVASPVVWALGSGGAGNSNRAAMGWTFQSGLGTGNGAVGPFKFDVCPAGASGTQVNPLITGYALHNTKSITNNSATGIASLTISNGSVIAGIARYSVEVTDGTDFQVEEGQVSFHVTNKGGVLANNVAIKSANQQAATAGTLVVTWTITAANPAVLTLNANSSLTPSAGYPRVTIDISNLTQQALALL